MQQAINELKEIKNQLKAEDSYFDRDQHSLASVVALPAETLVSKALQEYNQYVITTDGDIATITYQVRARTGAAFGAEIEAKDLAYIPGPVREIRFGNDLAQAGKNINLIKYHISRLAPPMVPPSPPGTRGEIVHPHIFSGGANSQGLEFPFDVAKFTGVGEPLVFTGTGLTTTNQFDSFQNPKGTDFAVTVAKRLIVYFLAINTTTAAKSTGLQFADTAVNNSATAGTNPVDITSNSYWENATANQTFECIGAYGEIPAGKFPAISASSDSGTILWAALGIEVDA